MRNSSYLSPAASLLALTYFWRGRPAFRRAHAFVYDALTHRACAGTDVLSRASALCGVRWAPRNVTPRVRGSSVNCLPANSADETPMLTGLLEPSRPLRDSSTVHPPHPVQYRCASESLSHMSLGLIATLHVFLRSRRDISCCVNVCAGAGVRLYEHADARCRSIIACVRSRLISDI